MVRSNGEAGVLSRSGLGTTLPPMPPATHPWNMQRGKTVPRESRRTIARLQVALNHAWRTTKDSATAVKCASVQEAWEAFYSTPRAKLLQHGVGRYAVYVPGGVIYEMEHIPVYTGEVDGCPHTPDTLIGFVVTDVKMRNPRPEFHDLLYFRNPDMAVLAMRHKDKLAKDVTSRGFHATVIHRVYTCQHRTAG